MLPRANPGSQERPEGHYLQRRWSGASASGSAAVILYDTRCKTSCRTRARVPAGPRSYDTDQFSVPWTSVACRRGQKRKPVARTSLNEKWGEEAKHRTAQREREPCQKNTIMILFGSDKENLTLALLNFDILFAYMLARG